MGWRVVGVVRRRPPSLLHLCYKQLLASSVSTLPACPQVKLDARMASSSKRAAEGQGGALAGKKRLSVQERVKLQLLAEYGEDAQGEVG